MHCLTAQLAAGVPTSQVIENLREQRGGDPDAGRSRAYFVGRKDINNIRRSIGISAADDSTKHADDQTVKLARQQLWEARDLQDGEIAEQQTCDAELVGAEVTVIQVTNMPLPTWDVRVGPEDSSQLLYRVEQEHQQCPELCCRQHCQECRACIHNFRCSCPDRTVHKQVCQHIHAVCLLLEVPPFQLSGTDPPSPDMMDDASEYLQQPSRRKQETLANLAALTPLLTALPDDTEDRLFDVVDSKVTELMQLLTKALD